MNLKIGSTIWYVPDCYYPEKSSEGYYESHEAICVLNTGDRDANLNITLYFEDREPSSGFKAICPSKRTNHVRLDEITDGEGRKIPRGVPYAIVLESDEPIVAQYSRLDTTQAELGLMTTMAYPL
ncbi:MAG: hypothetical protein GX974_05545 [Clostridiales bacterium]|nr:hypothetical protein [Clostridiales bacterium]